MAITADRRLAAYGGRVCTAPVAGLCICTSDITCLSSHLVGITITTDGELAANDTCAVAVARDRVCAPVIASLSGGSILVAVTAYRQPATRGASGIAVASRRVGTANVIALLADRGIRIAVSAA